LTRVLVECVVDRKLPDEELFISKAHRSETLRHGPQADPFGGRLLLPLDVRRTDNQRQALQPRCLEMVVLNNRFERTANSPMV